MQHPQDPTPKEERNSDRSPAGALFIDNSHILIEGQKFHAQYLNLKVMTDPCFRIDIGKLCQALLGERRMSDSKLYGSETPALDSLWERIKQRGLSVDKFERNYKDKEKEVDIALTTDAIEYVCVNDEKKSYVTIFILAGDRDYYLLVEKILARGWNVVVAAFSFSLSRKLKDKATSTKQLQIVEVDKLLREQAKDKNAPCCFYVNRQWRSLNTDGKYRRIPRERTKVFSFRNHFDMKNRTHIDDIRELADSITSVLRIPCSYHIDEQRANTVFIIFILSRNSKRETGECMTLSARLKLADDVWKNGREKILRECRGMLNKYEFDKCEDILEYLQSRQGISQYETGLENQFAALGSGDDDDSDDDNLCMSDEFEDCKLDSAVPAVDDASNDVEEDYEGFLLKSREKKAKRTISEPCKYGFNCSKARQCEYEHSVDEVEYFKYNSRQGIKRKNYKSKPCYQNAESECKTGNHDISPLCAYYHSELEARCYICQPNKGMIGHQATLECEDKVNKR